MFLLFVEGTSARPRQMKQSDGQTHKDVRFEVYTKNKFENVWSLAETHGNGNAKYLRIIDCVWIWCYGSRWEW